MSGFGSQRKTDNRAVQSFQEMIEIASGNEAAIIQETPRLYSEDNLYMHRNLAKNKKESG